VLQFVVPRYWTACILVDFKCTSIIIIIVVVVVVVFVVVVIIVVIVIYTPGRYRLLW